MHARRVLHELELILQNMARLRAEAISAQSAAIRVRVQPELVGAALFRIAEAVCCARKRDAQDVVFALAERLRSLVDRSRDKILDR